jgi:hypothetical protein
LRAPTPKGAALLTDLGGVTPTIVYTGPTRTPDQLARLNVAADEPAHGDVALIEAWEADRWVIGSGRPSLPKFASSSSSLASRFSVELKS